MRRQFRIFHGKTLKAGSACLPGFINVARPEQLLPVFLDDLQRLDAATLDKALEMKVNLYPAHLKQWGLRKTDWGSRSPKTCGLGRP
jgi:hypothetical protein